MHNLINVNNLTVSYNRFKALGNVSFKVTEGDFFGIIGESGSGKTTLANTLLRILPSDAGLEGDVLYKGENLLSFTEKQMIRLRGKDIFLIPQEPAASFNPVFTIGYQFEEFLRYKRPQKSNYKKIIKTSLSNVNISDVDRIINSYPHQLSGGQLQRAMIALAVAIRPTLLVADEPTSSLDVILESQLMYLFSRLRKELGLTIIFITHNLELVNKFCHHGLVLQRGKVKEINDARELFLRPKDPYTVKLINDFKMLNG
jgi:peptide/nickel transport system ATP-binding protein